MTRRLLDIMAATTGLALLALPLGVVLLLVWRQDGHSPFYIASRVGRKGVTFRMVKIRSMVVNADSTGVESTSANDDRITPLGHFIRNWKIDELGQLWNVIVGEMSLVGPRPNTLGEVETYSEEERDLLSVRPGMTDFSSIVFSDEGDILGDSMDPDADYTLLIRPWKSKLGLIYARNPSALLNLRLIWLTVIAIFDKRSALDKLQPLLMRLGCDRTLAAVANRTAPRSVYGLPPVEWHAK